MVVKVYTSGICGSQEVRKRQQRVLFVLETMKIKYEAVDVTEPGRLEERTFMQEECKKRDKTDPLPPQIFNDNEYCGDFFDFQLASDDDVLLRFLKLEDETAAPPVANDVSAKQEVTSNGFTNEKAEDQDDTPATTEIEEA